jgi:FtsH-binding integral membrane protein
MDSQWAAENLQTIRTLMERSALYRRALAPIMTFVGALGLAGAIAGRVLNLNSPVGFILFWGLVAGVAMTGSFVLVRRQALRDAEPFWSPPTRRVTQAFLPPLLGGLVLSAVVAARVHNLDASRDIEALAFLVLPRSWIILYGCALHSAGLFMPRGMKVLGWFFVLCGAGLFAVDTEALPRLDAGYGLMGFFFGLVQLAYGFYLYFTEKGKNGV